MANAQFTIPTPINEPNKMYAPGSAEKLAAKEELKRQKSQKIEIPIIIGGKRITGRKKVDVICPHDKNHVLAECNQATKEDVAAAIENCLAARKKWAALPWEQRAAVFLKAADLLTNSWRQRINVSTMLCQSKTVFQAEIDAACELIDFWRFNVSYMEQIYGEQPISGPGIWNRTVARGLEGFVFTPSPFNFTSIDLNLPTAPAMMGCVALWKPAPTSMLSSYYGMLLLEEAGLPPGVINFIPGEPAEIGDTVLKHPDLSGVHFTGSTATFNHFWKTIGANIDNYKTYPRVVGETGGKDFIFAHPTADRDALVTAMVRGSFEYQGQKCSAASRAFVPKSLWEYVKPRLVETTNSLKMGDVEDFTNFMSAVIDQRSFDKIKGFIDHAKADKDCEIIAGGEYDDSKGFYVRPTVIVTTNPNYQSICKEIFGPVLTVYVYDDNDLDETLEICDTQSPYALTGAIFAQDRNAIDYMANALEHAAGNFYINDKPTGAVVGQQPFGGSRASGTNDKAGSKLNLLRWMSQRTIKETFSPAKDHTYPHMSES
jgi:1-pyrroline-5-carboxylate dehydrogenase